MVKDVLDAFVDRNPEAAIAVCRARHATVDNFLLQPVPQSLLTFMMENPQAITPSAHLLFIAKNLERNRRTMPPTSAEMVLLQCHRHGTSPTGPRGDDTAFATQAA